MFIELNIDSKLTSNEVFSIFNRCFNIVRAEFAGKNATVKEQPKNNCITRPRDSPQQKNYIIIPLRSVNSLINACLETQARAGGLCGVAAVVEDYSKIITLSTQFGAPLGSLTTPCTPPQSRCLALRKTKRKPPTRYSKFSKICLERFCTFY